jgi:hypothetical protein
MDGEEIYGAVKAALDDHAREQRTDTNRPDMLMPLQRFEAVGPDDEELTVIGVGYLDDILQFLCIVEEDGEIWPAMREQVFRKPGEEKSEH